MKTLITMILLFITIELFAPVNHITHLFVFEPVNPYESLFKAVCTQESNCNEMAINEKEQAYGISQIRQIRLDDYYRLTGIKYELKDCLNISISKEIFMYYASRYGHNDLGRIARKWNGSGLMTFIYWNKVQKIMHKNYSYS